MDQDRPSTQQFSSPDVRLKRARINRLGDDGMRMLKAEKSQAEHVKKVERGQKFIRETRSFKQSEFFDLQNTRRAEKYHDAKNKDRERDRKATEAYLNVKSKLKDYHNSVKESPSPKLRQKQGE